MSENETTGQDALSALNALDEATPAPTPAAAKRAPRPATAASTDKAVQAVDPAQPETPAPAARQPRANASMRIPELPTWGPEDYGVTLAGSGALKLADSGVAPLVALARGYARVDEGNFTDVMKTVGSKLNSKQGRRLKRTIGEGTGEGMTMPWYSIADLQNARRTGNDAVPICYQIRPARPEMGDNGRPLKYEFLFGGITPLDIHPAVPSTWIDATPVVVIAEGLLKGDSALSAYLFENGASWDDLAGVGVEDPAARLAELLEAIPEADRLVIISIAGIYNTSQNPVDWREINLKGREGWIAFDADLEENKFVYDAAVRLWKDLEGRARMGKMKILNPTSTTGDGGMIAKMGVDDYLAQVGQWSDLVQFLDDALPAPPQRDADEKAGNWRISKDGCAAEECMPVMNGPGGTLSGYVWDEKLDLGGRIHGSDTRRQPTDSEIRRGVLDPNIGIDDVEAVNARVEISWRAGGDKDGVVISSIVEGPENFLGYSPTEWDKRGARIPTALLRHPSWPPRGVSGEKWLSAIKGNRVSEIVDSTRWMQMGWVPVEGHDPAFIIGDQVIGDPDMEPGSVLPGVDSSELPVTGHYGVNRDAIGADWNDPRHVELMRQDIRDVVKAYVTDEPFTKRESVALILAAALRPVLPLRPRATCYLWGPKGGGKALPLDERIPVPVSDRFPSGWATNADLELGDHVYSADGQPTRIRSFSDTFNDEVYEFELSDGRTVRSSAKHLWKVSTVASRGAHSAAKGKGNGQEARTGKSQRLREYAASMTSGDASPIEELVSATGFSRPQIEYSIKASGIQSQTVVLTGDTTGMEGLEWVNLPKEELSTYVQSDGGTLAEAIAAGTTPSRGLTRGLRGGGTMIAARSIVYPVAEVLTALADRFEYSRPAPMPIETTMTAEDIVAGAANGERYAIRGILPMDGPDLDLPIPAYTLGAWLGDGTRVSGGFTSADQEILDQIHADGYATKRWPSADYGYNIVGLLGDLRTAGVLGNKHIPAAYLRGSYAQRLALLQGLMDTDGSIDERGKVELTLCDRRLADDAFALLRTFGVRVAMHASDASLTEEDPDNPGQKRRRVVGTRYRMNFRSNLPVFRLGRKAERVSQIGIEKWLFVNETRALGEAPVRCLTVEHPTGMFAQDDFVLSHNSWGAERMMAFWAKQSGDWIGMLPGSAKDTFAYLENAVARSNIWVVDDLAPSSNKRQVETENQKLEDLTRQIFNNATKGRMNADMTSRKVNKPVAQLIMTAENELGTPSARERLVPLYIGKGSLNPSSAPTDALEALHAEGTPARLTAHLIRYVRHQASEQDGGWAAWMTNLEARVKHSQEIVGKRMKDKGASSGSLKRTATLAADLIIVFDLVRQFARYLGMEKEILDLFGSDGLPKDLIELVHHAHAENQTHAPGVSVISALSMLLAMGGAHVAAAEDPLRPPLVDSEGLSDTFANMALGWVSGGSDGSLKGNGPRIGVVVTVNGERTILFDQQTAFKKAQDAFPDILQHGQQPSAAWSSVWDEKLASDKVKRRKNSRGYALTTHRVRVGDGSVTGVPVPVNTITKGTWRADSDAEDAVSEELTEA